MNSMYSACWAQSRGDCDRGMSREHLVSNALFPERMAYVSGFDWCKGIEKHVGINSLQRKILCGKHNNDLSPADDEAVHALSAFQSGQCRERAIYGLRLERWMLKTAINLSLGSDMQIGCGMSDSVKGKPNPYLLAVAFGDLPLSANMGAYFLSTGTAYLYREGELSLVPIHRDGEIGGFLFGLRGIFVFLSLLPTNVPPSTVNFIAPGVLPKYLEGAILLYRPTNLELGVGTQKLGRVLIEWSTQ